MLLIGISARVCVKAQTACFGQTCGDKGGSARKTLPIQYQILIRKYCAVVHTCIYTHSLLLYICDTDLIIHTAIDIL